MLDPAQRISRVRQTCRAARVLVHVVQGLAITTFIFPRVADSQRRALNRRWSARLLSLLAIDVKLAGDMRVDGGNVVYAANHISWLDIFVLDAQSPARFIAKSELARWPVIGRLIRDTGTIFLERARKVDTLRVNALATDALSRGDFLAVFPEGTTTDGTTLLKFHGSLLQPVIDSHGHVQPIALRYAYADGSPSLATQYAGDTSFAQSFWRVCGTRAQVVEVTAHAPIAARDRTRRQLAESAETAIRSTLALPAPAPPASAMAPATPADRRDPPR